MERKITDQRIVKAQNIVAVNAMEITRHTHLDTWTELLSRKGCGS